jgi:hypothetical protein
MQKLRQERWHLLLILLGTSIQQKDKESSLNIAPPSYTGSRLELRDLPTCPKLHQLPRSQRKHQLIFNERLCEAFQVYTPFDLEVPESQQMVRQCLWPSHMLTFAGNFRNWKFNSLELMPLS